MGRHRVELIRDGSPGAEYAFHMRELEASVQDNRYRLRDHVHVEDSTYRSAFTGTAVQSWGLTEQIVRAAWLRRQQRDNPNQTTDKFLGSQQWQDILDRWDSFHKALTRAQESPDDSLDRQAPHFIASLYGPVHAGDAPATSAGGDVIHDPAVAALRWGILTPLQKQELFDRFQKLTPDPGIPSYWRVRPELQRRSDDERHGRIDFGAANEFLAANDLSVEFGTPLVQSVLDKINSSGPDGLVARLMGSMEPYVRTKTAIPPGRLRNAWADLFDWLAQPQIDRADQQWDVLIVPGNRSDLKHRVDAVADLRDSDEACDAMVLFSGAHPRYENRPTPAIGEAEAMAWYLEQLRPDVSYTPVIDSRARTTEETMYNAIGHIRVAQRARLDGGLKGQVKVAVVTSPYHVRRAHLLANRIIADDRLAITDEVHVIPCAQHFTPELILDGEPDHRDRRYAAKVLIQEMLKIPGGRATGVF